MEREIYSMKMVATAAGQDMDALPQEVRETELTEEDRRLSPDDMREKARDMVFGSAYQDARALIMSNISYFFENAVESARQEQIQSAQMLEKSLVRQRICISILFVLNIVTFFMVIILIVKPLQIYIRCIKEDKMLEIAGGATLYVPQLESLLRPVRDARIKAEFNGWNYLELAHKYKVTDRLVRSICGPGIVEGQIDLFRDLIDSS